MSALVRFCVLLLLPTFLCLAVQPPAPTSKSICFSDELSSSSSLPAEECNESGHGQGGNYSQFEDADCNISEASRVFDLVESEYHGSSHFLSTIFRLLETCFQPPELAS